METASELSRRIARKEPYAFVIDTEPRDVGNTLQPRARQTQADNRPGPTQSTNIRNHVEDMRVGHRAKP